MLVSAEKAAYVLAVIGAETPRCGGVAGRGCRVVGPHPVWLAGCVGGAGLLAPETDRQCIVDISPRGDVLPILTDQPPGIL